MTARCGAAVHQAAAPDDVALARQVALEDLAPPCRVWPASTLARQDVEAQRPGGRALELGRRAVRRRARRAARRSATRKRARNVPLASTRDLLGARASCRASTAGRRRAALSRPGVEAAGDAERLRRRARARRARPSRGDRQRRGGGAGRRRRRRGRRRGLLRAAAPGRGSGCCAAAGAAAARARRAARARSRRMSGADSSARDGRRALPADAPGGRRDEPGRAPADASEQQERSRHVQSSDDAEGDRVVDRVQRDARIQRAGVLVEQAEERSRGRRAGRACSIGDDADVDRAEDERR